MVFADLFFLYFFLPLCLVLYFATKRIAYRNAVLIVFSLIFYAWGEPKWIFLLLVSTLVNWLLGLIIGKNNESVMAKIALALSLVFNIGALGVFKYSGFIVENINSAFGTSISAPGFTLPIGISFYTFQILSYTIDVYREIDEEMDDDDISLDQFSDDIEDWIIDILKKQGYTTARQVLGTNREELAQQADLEEETIDEIIRVLSAEFEK